MMDSRTFISYESGNRDEAFRVCEYLESRGITCWIAPRDIHAGEYAGEITRALRSAGTMVIVCSRSTSSSAHVRNEVSLAFGNGCRLVPFCIEDVALDDSLQYYFAGKQRVYVRDGDLERGLDDLYSVLSGPPVRSATPKPAAEDVSGKRSHRRIVPIAGAALAVAALLVLIPKLYVDREAKSPQAVPLAEAVTAEASEEPQQAASSPETSAAEAKAVPSPETVASPEADTFTGTIKNGYPNGAGTYTFRQNRRISMCDEKARTAQAGDRIEGIWADGQLVQGRWFAADGTDKGLIVIGESVNPRIDHCFAKCTKP